MVENRKSGLEMKFLKRETHYKSQTVKLVFGKAFLWIQIAEICNNVKFGGLFHVWGAGGLITMIFFESFFWWLWTPYGRSLRSFSLTLFFSNKNPLTAGLKIKLRD